MSEAPNVPVEPPEDLTHLAKDWIWFLILGAGLVLLGMFAIGAAPLTTLAAAKVFGLILIIGGIIQTVTAFWSPKWSGVMVQMLIGILYIIVGLMVSDCPIETALGLALFVSIFLFISGIFRIVSALQTRFAGWPWVLLNGFVSVLLGMYIWSNWPASVVIVGVFVGLEIMFNGVSWIMFSMLLRKIHKSVAAE